jgi:hypothetical protein
LPLTGSVIASESLLLAAAGRNSRALSSHRITLLRRSLMIILGIILLIGHAVGGRRHYF